MIQFIRLPHARPPGYTRGKERTRMNCRLLLINRGKSFLIDSIVNGLEEAGVRCTCTEPVVRSIEKLKGEADMLLLYGDEELTDMADVLVYIKDICADDAMTLYLAGSPDALEPAEELIPQELVRAEFIRPFDVKKLIAEIVSDAEKITEQKKAKEILIVDDDTTFLKMMRRWLLGKYQVTVVKSGIQAIKYLTGHRPDLILMDYDMPVTTGSQVLEMIRSEPDSEDIPVIFLTGKADRATVMQVMSLKPQGYLLKSMQQSEIVAAIDRFFETSKWQNAMQISGSKN